MRQSRARRTFSVPAGSTTFGQICTCISIASIVAYILSPGWYEQSSPKARQASCMSNMKQIGLAVIGYTMDYDEKFPTGSATRQIAVRLPSGSAATGLAATKPGQSHGLGTGWAGGANEYFRSAGVFKCPDDNSGPPARVTETKAFPVSYAINEWLAGQQQSVVVSASTTVLGFECSNLRVDVTNRLESGGPNHSPVGDGASEPATGVPAFGDGFDTFPGFQHMIVNNRGAFARHDVDGAGGGGSMYLLCDGHVKFLRYNDVSVGKRPVSQSKLGKIYKASFNPVK